LSTLQKTFVVIVLVLSVLVAVATMGLFAQRQNYRAKAEAADATVAKVKREKSDVEARYKEQLDLKNVEIRSLENKVLDKDHEIQVLKTDIADLGSQIADVKAQLAQITTENSSLADSVKAMTERTAGLEKELETVKKERKDSFDKEKRAVNKVAVLERDRKSLTEQLKELDISLKKLRQQYAQLKEGIAASEGTQPSKSIDGRIHSKKANMVIISVGSNDGVEKDFLFHVYRGDEYLGKVKVTKVDPQFAYAEIQEKYTQDINNIKEGDNVATILAK